jgi:hypothetical protein
MMFNFTLESIGKIGFGVKFNAMKQKRLELHFRMNNLLIVSGLPIILTTAKPMLMNHSLILFGSQNDS